MKKLIYAFNNATKAAGKLCCSLNEVSAEIAKTNENIIHIDRTKGKK